MLPDDERTDDEHPDGRPRLALYSDAEVFGGVEVNLSRILSFLPESIDVTIIGVDDEIVDWLVAHRHGSRGLTLPLIRGRTDFRRILEHHRTFRLLGVDLRPRTCTRYDRTPRSGYLVGRLDLTRAVHVDTAHHASRHGATDRTRGQRIQHGAADTCSGIATGTSDADRGPIGDIASVPATSRTWVRCGRW